MTFKTPLVPYARFPAEMPQLPVRDPVDPDGPIYVVRAHVSQEHAQGLRLSGITQKETNPQITGPDLQGIVEADIDR